MSVSAQVPTSGTANTIVDVLVNASALHDWSKEIIREADGRKTSDPPVYALLYVYRENCPYCREFAPRLAALLDRILAAGVFIDFAEIDKEQLLHSAWLDAAPTVPALISYDRSSNSWQRMPRGEKNRSYLRLLEFLADTWSLPALEPCRVKFLDLDDIADTTQYKYRLYVDYLPMRDFPPTPLLKARTESKANGANDGVDIEQQTHDLMLRHCKNDRGVALVNRVFLPPEDKLHLSVHEDRAQEEPRLFDAKTGRRLDLVAAK